MVLSSADRFGDAEAVVDGTLRLSFVQVVDRIRCAAGAFASIGIEKGDRAAIWAPNSAEWIIAAFGLLTVGGVLVPVNTRFKPDEAGDIIVRSGRRSSWSRRTFWVSTTPRVQPFPPEFRSSTSNPTFWPAVHRCSGR